MITIKTTITFGATSGWITVYKNNNIIITKFWKGLSNRNQILREIYAILNQKQPVTLKLVA
jgi:hypothetical protein